MFGFRTPTKGPTDEGQCSTSTGHTSGQVASVANVREHGTTKAKGAQPSSVRRSIGEWESGKPVEAPKSATSPPKKARSVDPLKLNTTRTLSQDIKAGARRISTEVVAASPPMTNVKCTDRLAEAKACVQKAKTHLGNSRNIKTEIKTEVTNAIERLYQLVKEADSVKGQGKKKANEPEKEREPQEGKESRNEPEKEQREEEKELMRKIDEHTKLIQESNERMDRLKETIEKHQEMQEKLTYANVAAAHPRRQPPEQTALHSVVVTAKNEKETGDEILTRIREAVKAKEGGIEVERIRKGKDRKVIVGCRTEKDREQVKERLKGAEEYLNVQEVKNKDPLVILRDVLQYNSDKDIIGALWTQNKRILKDLREQDNKVEVMYRKRSRNPQVNSVIMRVPPKVWQCLVDAESIMIDLQRVKVADQSPLVQCSLCLGYGHGRRFCKDTIEKCSHCGGPHMKTDCADWLAGAAPTCCNCMRAKHDRVDHNAFSGECPIRQRWETIARATIAYQC